MAFRRKYMKRKRPYRKRRVYRKRSNKRSTITRVPQTGIADRMFTKLVYCDTLSITGDTTGDTEYNVFRGNSIYDPDYSHVGHQPMYRDTYAGIYSKYRVRGCKIEVWAANYAASSDAQLILVPAAELIADDTPLSTLLEQRSASVGRIMPLSGYAGGYQKRYISSKKVFGLSKNEYVNAEYGSVVGSNPSSQWYWHVCAANLNAETTVNIKYTVRLTYYVEWSVPYVSAQS